MDKEKIENKLSDDLKIIAFREHSKASEKYIDVEIYSEGEFVWYGSIPYYYRRTGLFIENEVDLVDYLKEIKKFFTKESLSNFVNTETKHWDEELFGKKTGVSKGKGGSMHLFDINLNFYGGNAIVGGHLPIAVGAAYAKKFKGENGGVFAIFGDGASNSGAFYESINIATAWKLPIIFFLENNYYAIGTHISRVSPFTELVNKAKNYMATKRIDGMDIFEVYNSVVEAKNYIETGVGPYFIEAETFRFEGHSISDAGKYRSEEELDIFKKRDPINRLKQQMLDYGIENEYFDEIDLKVEKIIDESVEFALNSDEPDKDELFKDVLKDSYVI